MRENLVFYGIQEEPSENCEALVKTMIQTELGMDPTNMTFDRVHRLGVNNKPKPRPMVVKFHSYNDKERVRSKAMDPTIRTKLKDKRLGIGPQTPQIYRDARKAFFPIAKQEQDRGNYTRITGTKLFVNNVLKKRFIDGKVCDVLTN